MKFCPVVPEICRGHVHVPKKERRIIIRNGAQTISLETLFGRLNNNKKKRSKNNISLKTLFGRLNNLSRSVMNGKQYKHQNTLSYSSQFMVKRPVS